MAGSMCVEAGYLSAARRMGQIFSMASQRVAVGRRTRVCRWHGQRWHFAASRTIASSSSTSSRANPCPQRPAGAFAPGNTTPHSVARNPRRQKPGQAGFYTRTLCRVLVSTTFIPNRRPAIARHWLGTTSGPDSSSGVQAKAQAQPTNSRHRHPPLSGDAQERPETSTQHVSALNDSQPVTGERRLIRSGVHWDVSERFIFIDGLTSLESNTVQLAYFLDHSHKPLPSSRLFCVP
jgi:hypothetical protein